MRYESTAKLLKKYREEAGLTQVEAGEKLDIHYQYISNIESGKMFYPKRTLKKMKSIYKLNKNQIELLWTHLMEDVQKQVGYKYKDLISN